MDFNKLFESFKNKCKTVRKFINTKTGRNMFLIALVVFILLFFAPLFHGSVGAALISCVAAPLTVLIWRRYDKRHAVVPAVFFCIPMILDMLIYHTLSTAACLLVAIVCVLLCAIHPSFAFTHTIKDNMYAYLACGAVCVGIVVLASLLILLVSVAWWLFCLFLFIAVVAVFFTVVLSTAAYTATDDRRQAKKKQRKAEHKDEVAYDFDTFAEEVGLKNEREVHSSRNPDRYHSKVEVEADKNGRNKQDPLFYDVD
ncbi:MAG: hypothetical protein IJ433_07645 [Ruminococcus sp.]|nr:hypothetical protein [Ruminococcus sp.]